VFRNYVFQNRKKVNFNKKHPQKIYGGDFLCRKTPRRPLAPFAIALFIFAKYAERSKNNSLIADYNSPLSEKEK